MCAYFDRVGYVLASLALWQGLETEFTDTPQSKKRKWQRKHSRPDSDADRRQLHPSLKRLKAYSSNDENESFIAEADNSSGEELEVCGCSR